jgi:hypothetical protein
VAVEIPALGVKSGVQILGAMYPEKPGFYSHVTRFQCNALEYTPIVGLEPTTLGLTVPRSTS